MLIALDAVSLPTGPTPPKQLRVAKWGVNDSTKGKVVVNERTAKLLPQLQRVTGFDRVALDFEHNTLPGSDAYKASSEPRKIGATGVPVVVPGDGLYMDALEWTPEGTEAYSGKHFPDLSPAVKREEDGTVIFMHSSALTRNGSIFDLHAFSASPDPVDLFRTMDPKVILLSLLGLKADATDEQITTAAAAAQKQIQGVAALEKLITGFSAALEQLTASNKTATEEIAALKTGLAGAGKETAAATITTLSAELKGTKDTVVLLVQRLDAQEREAAIAEAVQQGKIVPFSTVRELPVVQAKKLLEELPKDQVPTQRRTVEGVTAFAASSAVQLEDATARKMREAAGVSEEDLKKFGGR